MTSEQRKVRRAIYLSLLMVTLASTAAAAAKFASTSASAAAIVTVQYAICMLLCLPTALRPGLSHLRTQRWRLHLLRGAAGVLGFYLYYAALANVPLVDALLLRQSAPLVVPLVMWAWSRERIAAAHWAPLIAGFIGVAVILRPDTGGVSAWHVAGFASALALAISMVATFHLAVTEPVARVLFYYFALSLLCVAPFGLGDLAGIRWQDWLAMLYVGVSLYYTLDLYTRAYGMAPASAIAPINYLAVVLGGLWGWLIWQQLPDLWSVLGSALVIGGGLLTIYLARDKPVESELGQL
jgi:drug/metabolite transporter (DMT)-like permease